MEMNILHSGLIFQQWVVLNSAKSNVVSILSIVGQKKKVSCFQLPDPLLFMVSKIFVIHQLIRNHYVMWWSYWVLNLGEERNVVYEDHISFLQSFGIKQTNKTYLFDGYYRHFQQYYSYIVAVSCIGGGNRRKPPTCRKSMTNFIT